MPDSQTIRNEELASERQTGKPNRKIYISPEGLRNAELFLYITISAKERESSPYFKVLFREMLGDLVQLTQLGIMPSKEGLEDEFSKIWNKPRSKLFQQQAEISPDMAGASSAMGGGMSGRPNTSGTPKLPASMPSLAG